MTPAEMAAEAAHLQAAYAAAVAQVAAAAKRRDELAAPLTRLGAC